MKLMLVQRDLHHGLALSHALDEAGHAVQWHRRLASAQARGGSAFEMLVLNPRLPDGDGLVLVRRMREGGERHPVLCLLPEKTETVDRVRAMKAGADEFVSGTAAPAEVLARVEALRRRLGQERRVALGGGVALDIDLRRATREGSPVSLTLMEWAVLLHMVRQTGRVHSRGEIEAALRREGVAAPQSNSLEVIISRLRRKLGDAVLTTVRGLGYRLVGF